jgi:hypothetical protein
MERGWLDMAVDPKRYGLRSAGLVRFLARFMMKPSAIVLVEVPASVAKARKDELSVNEINRQFAAWRSVASTYAPLIIVDNSDDIDTVIAQFIKEHYKALH